MTSRKRVQAALSHAETERPPIDLGATRTSGISAIAYRNLLGHLGIEEEVRVFDCKQQLAEVSPAVADRLGVDVLPVPRLALTSAMPFLCLDRWKPGALTDGTHCLVPEGLETREASAGRIEIVHDGVPYAWRSPESYYFDVTYAPLAAAETPAEIDAYQFPDPWSGREEAFVRERLNRMAGSDKALFGSLPMWNCSFFELSLVLFGHERFMLMLLEEPALVERWLDRLLEHDFDILGQYLALAGPHLDVIQLNDDFGAQNALQISPETYRRLFKPRQRRWIEFVKARTKAKVFIHCDGAVSEILRDFIEIGIDILNPLQTSARGMAAAKIKAEFGKDLAFWGGGIDTQLSLPFRSVAEIRSEVRENIRVLGEGGGFVFATVHNIQPDIPPEKVLAVFESAVAMG